jgi:hypothetical protein
MIGLNNIQMVGQVLDELVGIVACFPLLLLDHLVLNVLHNVLHIE